ncbi:hypothetical protein N752_08985 [Desulforamulus aquiferis]|nr:DUF881 domain-containing protein [Desulforamulus aquiferis]RYD05469.1 hypothetical protein N752_08985 [Desulforamulus aquiferis]
MSNSENKGLSIGYSSCRLGTGLMISIQYRFSREVNESPPIARVQTLNNEIKEKREARNQLEKRVVELRERLDQKANVQPDNFAAEMETSRIIAGIQAVSGPGVEVTLNDSNVVLQPGQDPNLYVLHDEDVLRVLNELKAAGAEAIA